MLSFEWPVKGRISSGFGWRWIKVGNMIDPTKLWHNGIDIAVPEGTAVIAPYKGFVWKIWESKRAGRCLRVYHDSCSIKEVQVYTDYYHLTSVVPELNWRVNQGEVIAYTGDTGLWTTGPHLHFGVLVGDRYIDPRVVFNV